MTNEGDSGGIVGSAEALVEDEDENLATVEELRIIVIDAEDLGVARASLPSLRACGRVAIVQVSIYFYGFNRCGKIVKQNHTRLNR